jgi:hypothetical protein
MRDEIDIDRVPWQPTERKRVPRGGNQSSILCTTDNIFHCPSTLDSVI